MQSDVKSVGPTVKAGSQQPNWTELSGLLPWTLPLEYMVEPEIVELHSIEQQSSVQFSSVRQWSLKCRSNSGRGKVKTVGMVRENVCNNSQMRK